MFKNSDEIDKTYSGSSLSLWFAKAIFLVRIDKPLSHLSRHSDLASNQFRFLQYYEVVSSDKLYSDVDNFLCCIR